MEICDKVIVITGASGGVGTAAARRFTAEGSKVVLTDIDAEALDEIASELDAPSLAGNICSEVVVQKVAQLARDRFGRIDIWFSNAGSTGARRPGMLPDNAEWQFFWDLHVMSHVHAAREVLPEMLARGEGYLLHTASAVALSILLDKAHYSVTKSAALSFSEWLAANFRPRGIRVSCFCPGSMDTKMFRDAGLPPDHPAYASALKAEQIADVLMRGIRAEKFLIDSTGPVEAASLLARKAVDYEGWFSDMIRQQGAR